MHGNVSEWTIDWFNKEPRGGIDPIQTWGTYRVIRGGSYGSYAAKSRSAIRFIHFNFQNKPSPSYIDLGFRLVRTLP